MLHITHKLTDAKGNMITAANALAVTLLCTDAYLIAHNTAIYVATVAHV